MSNIIDSLNSIKHLDDLSRIKSSIHRIHPVAKVVTTFIYLIAVVSFGKYEISNLISFVFFPVLIFTLGEIPVLPILKKLLLVCPLIIGIGILNPFFDSHMVSIFGFDISRGWIAFLSILIKSGLTVTASILLLATTGIDKIATALRILKVPRVFVLQLLLTYRYISVLLEEVSRMTMAYSLRAPGQKGISAKVWGSFVGQLLLRTFDRAQRIYQSMNLRGFDGEYHTGGQSRMKVGDFAFISIWCLFFVIARIYNIPDLIGILIGI